MRAVAADDPFDGRPHLKRVLTGTSPEWRALADELEGILGIFAHEVAQGAWEKYFAVMRKAAVHASNTQDSARSWIEFERALEAFDEIPGVKHGS